MDRWTSFAGLVKHETPACDAYVSDQTIASTVPTWFGANGVCLTISLFFTQKITLRMFVMVAIVFFFLYLLFAVFIIPSGRLA